MINNIPSVVYDKNGNVIRVIKSTPVFFKSRGEYGYVFHIEMEERITSISEYELTKEDEKYVLTRKVFTSSFQL